MTRPLALWCAPRTVSTAFERMMIERGDHVVVDEPFSAAYYLGPERVSGRYGEEEATATFAQVLADLEALAATPGGPSVFVKDMAYQLGPQLRADTLARFTNTFLIRDPARTVPSLHRKWPDFTDDEVGYEALAAAFDLAAELSGTTPVVIDSDDLLRDPQTVVGSYCEAVGIPFLPDALTWEPGMAPQWTRWRDWYEGAAASTGFGSAPSAAPPEEADPRVRAAIDAARPAYEHLRMHRH